MMEDRQIHPQFNTRGDLMHDGRWGNVVTVNGRTDETLALEAGERLRLRLLNAANGRVFAPDFSALDARVVAVDGMLVPEPFVAKTILLAPGNRVDLDIRVRPEDEGSRFEIEDTFTRQRFSIASLSVSGKAAEVRDFAPPSNANFPDWSAAMSREPDFVYRLNARRGGKFGIEWTMNDRAWPQEERFALENEEFYKIRFANDSGRLHPMHLHGVFFQVLARDGKAPPMRHWQDTVLVFPRETVDVALLALDKGRWANHCHIQEHAESGMFTTFQVE